MNPFNQAEITFRINRANETFKEALDLAATIAQPVAEQARPNPFAALAALRATPTAD